MLTRQWCGPEAGLQDVTCGQTGKMQMLGTKLARVASPPDNVTCLQVTGLYELCWQAYCTRIMHAK